MNQDFKDLLRLFEEHEVEYLIVGGYAVIRYTQPRYTKDLDLWVRPSKENATRVRKAFQEFGIPLIEVTEEDFSGPGLQFMVGLQPNAIDFLTTIQGLDFDSAWNKRRIAKTNAGEIPYLAPDDLIISKRAVGRLQDLADVEEILRIHPDAEPK
jgi:hypothetical protein